METTLIYLLKTSLLLALFYACYQMFLKKETFFGFSRHFLMAGILIAFTLPFITLTKYVPLESITYQPLAATLVDGSVNATVQSFTWYGLLFYIYLLGVLFLTLRFTFQFGSLLKLVRSHNIEPHGGYYHVKTDKNIAPFSFFNYIFYNPSLYSKDELAAIIIHEQVHSSQWHSLDVLFSHLITIVTWVNPFSWLYKNNIKQNLEFLADENASKHIPSIKAYQYTLLKVSGNQFCAPIVNNFYNSLIKKRIVMLNKSKSDKKNMYKIGLLIPILAVFLVSFNTKEVYIPMDNNLIDSQEYSILDRTIEVTINKDTSDSELEEIKADLADKGLDFSYIVVHNSKKEIIEITVDLSRKKDDGKVVRSSSTFNNGDDPIDPIHIGYNVETNSFFMGNASMVDVHENVIVHQDKDVSVSVHTDSNKQVWIHADGEGQDHKTIEIIDKDGKEIIMVNGKKVSRKVYNKMKKDGDIHGSHINIRKHKGYKDQNVFIMKTGDHDEDVDINVISDQGNGFMLVHGDGDEKPMYVIDGKVSNEKDMRKLDSDDVESVRVLKGEKAIKKYGKKGENGVVLFTTKKKTN